MRGLLLIALAVSAPAFATTATFRYEAFVGAVRAGEAVVEIRTTKEGYEVRGRAKSKGLWEAISRWRARFSVAGIFGKKAPEPQRYYLFQKDDKKKREVTVQDGMLQYTKNGRQRPRRPAFPGADVLTALFIDGECRATVTIHTGRHGYELKRLGEAQESCRYHVVDEDGDEFDAEIRFAERHGLIVPVSIDVNGTVRGHMRLVDSYTVADPS